LKLLRTSAITLAVIAVATTLVVWWWVAIGTKTGKVADFSSLSWEETENGFITKRTAQNDGLVCVCGGYECPREFGQNTDIEPTHIAYEGRWHPGFIVVKDPLAGDHPSWGRKVHGSQTCVAAKKGTFVTLRLEKDYENKWLMLSIE